MNLLDNRPPEDKYKQKWVDPLFRDLLLFILSVLIVLQTFLIVYQFSQLFSSLFATYVYPLEVVKETDLDLLDDNKKVDNDFWSMIIDLIIEILKLSTLWIGLFCVIDVIEGKIGLIVFTLFQVFLLFSSIILTPIYFNRQQIGKSFYDRIENYSLIFIIFWQILLSVLVVYILIYNAIQYINNLPKK